MAALDWTALGARLGLAPVAGALDGHAGPYPAGLSTHRGHTALGLIVANADGHQWTLTRRWEPQARHPRRPDPNTIKFTDRALTERYVGVASDPEWFRTSLNSATASALVAAADANRLGACSIGLQDHLLWARYREPPDRVPDLAETLAALRALAELLDADENVHAPDPASAVLLREVPPRQLQELAGMQWREHRLHCALPRAGGWRERFKPGREVVLDWDAGTLRAEREEIDLATIRQVAAINRGPDVLLLALDVGGGIPFAGRCAANAAEKAERPGLGPPFVCG